MTDQFKLLQNENNLRTKCLKSENQNMLEKWIAYTQDSDIGSYDYELCRKELIGIALQKELEGKNLEHFFANEPRFITENIIQGCQKKSLKDYLLFDIRSYFSHAVMIYFLFDLLFGQSQNPASIYDIFIRISYILLMIPFRMIFTNVRIRTLANYNSLKPNGFLQTGIYLIFLLFILLAFLLFRPLNNILIPGFTHLHLTCSLGIVWLILTYYYRKYVDELINERP